MLPIAHNRFLNPLKVYRIVDMPHVVDVAGRDRYEVMVGGYRRFHHAMNVGGPLQGFNGLPCCCLKQLKIAIELSGKLKVDIYGLRL